MTKDRRPPWWFPPVSYVVAVMIIILITFSDKRFVPLAVSGQALLLIVALRGFMKCPPLVRWFTAMPSAHRFVLVLLVGGMILGHFTLRARSFYPFVAWEIFPFARTQDPVTCPEFIGFTRSGKQTHLLVEQLFPSLVQIHPLDDAKHFPPETLEQLVGALRTMYNQLHPSDPLVRIDLRIVAVQVHPSPNETRTEPSCNLWKRYDFSSAPSS